MYLTRAQAADRLNVSTRVVDGLIARGKLPAYRVGAKLIRILDDDIEAYMAQQRVNPAPEPLRVERPCRYVPGMKVV